MGCNGSKAAQAPAVNSPNLLCDNGAAKKALGAKRLSVTLGNMDGHEVSKPDTEVDPGHVLASEGTAEGTKLEVTDIGELLENCSVLQQQVSPSSGGSGGRKGKRGSVMIGSSTDLNTADSFKNKTTKENGDLTLLEATRIGYTCRKGLKPSAPNQDSYCMVRASNLSIYGIFDGHGADGHLISNFVKDELPKNVVQDGEFSDPTKRAEVLKRAFIKTHQSVEAAHAKKKFDAWLSGTTATLVVHDHGTSKLLVAHCADSACCLAKVFKLKTQVIKAIRLTEDHKPNLPEEKARIEKNGGAVVHDGYANHRVYASVAGAAKPYPGMAMSRALGDIAGHKEAGVIAEPTVKEVQLDATDYMLLLCSDGVWEFIEPQEAVEKVCASEKIQDGVEALVTKAWDTWIKEEGGQVVDDITAIAVLLQDSETNDGVVSVSV